MKKESTLLLFVLLFSSCFRKQQTEYLYGSYKIIKTENIQIDSSKAIIAGFLQDMRTNQPIPDGSVVIHGTTIGIMSDSIGYFRMTINSGDYIFYAGCMGYEHHLTKKIKILPNTKTELFIELDTMRPISCN